MQPQRDPIPAAQLRQLQQRSDLRGLLRLAGHLLAVIGTGALYTLARTHSAAWPLLALATLAYHEWHEDQAQISPWELRATLDC